MSSWRREWPFGSISPCVSPGAALVRSGASSIPQKPSKVPGRPTFENPTLGFEAVDTRGRPITRFVDETSEL